MAKNWKFVRKVIADLLKGRLSRTEAAIKLSVHKRTIRRYLDKVIHESIESLKETRGGNHRKLTPQ